MNNNITILYKILRKYKIIYIVKYNKININMIKQYIKLMIRQIDVINYYNKLLIKIKIKKIK